MTKVRPIKHIAIGTDANYLPRAVVFYKTLKKYYKDFTLHVFCFDDIAYDTLNAKKYPGVKPYHTSEFENEDLKRVKLQKNRVYEYYWTCNPTMGRVTIKNKGVESIAMADCDMMFFSSPEVIFEEFEGADVIIQPNNFSFNYEEQFIPVGYYCTSFQCFRNNKNGNNILNWWYQQCLTWCSSKFENGKFADQKYLDDWRMRFQKVREVENPGTNVAPWNVQKFDVSKVDGKVVLNNRYPLVYYHFHSFRMNLIDYSYVITGDRNNNYIIAKDVLKYVYKPYITQMKAAIKELRKVKTYDEYAHYNPEGVQLDPNGKKLFK